MYIALVLFLAILLLIISSRHTTTATTSMIVSRVFMGVSTVIVMISIFIFISLVTTAKDLFEHVPLASFIFGTRWEPHSADPSFGILPLICGTILVVLISMLIAVPVAVMSALFITQFAGRTSRPLLKHMLEIPASIPSIVYGYFGLFKLAPLVFALATKCGLEVSYENSLSAGITISVMITPIIFSMTYDTIESTPRSWQYAALALGATRTEVALSIVLPYLSRGLASAMFLSVARVVGETMIVVLIVGLRPNITANPFSDATTVTTQIVNLLNGDSDFQSPQVLAAYALGMALFVITLALSMLAMYTDRSVGKKYKGQ